MYVIQLSTVLFSLQSMVSYDFFKCIDKAKLFPDDIQQLAIMPEAITKIVATLGDSDHDVCNTAINGLVELAKHGNCATALDGQIELICF